MSLAARKPSMTLDQGSLERKNVDWALTQTRDRALDCRILSRVRYGSSVLDLGCGRGELLSLLKDERAVREAGIELDSAAVTDAISRGLSVVQGDLEEGLGHLGDNSFDLVIMNQVLTVIRDPVLLIRESLRVGRQTILTFPNFAAWRNRLQLGMRGRLPVTRNLPYQWYNTPNIRLVTISDFRTLCRDNGFRIAGEAFVKLSAGRNPRPVTWWPNLRASSAMYVLEKQQ